MQVLDSKENLCNIKAWSTYFKWLLFFRESFFLAEQPKKLSAWTVLKNKEKFLLVLEGAVYFNQKLMTDFSQNLFFHHYAFLLLHFFNVFLLHGLKGIELACGFLTNKDHLCIGATAQHREHCIVLELVFGLHLNV